MNSYTCHCDAGWAGTNCDQELNGYHKEITILGSRVAGSGSHTDFPVLISIVDSDLRTSCEPDGSDIAFYLGTTPLNFEIESFDLNYTADEARLVAWVRIPSLSTSTNTIIKMFYGLPPGGYETPSGVWSSDLASRR